MQFIKPAVIFGALASSAVASPFPSHKQVCIHSDEAHASVTLLIPKQTKQDNSKAAFPNTAASPSPIPSSGGNPPSDGSLGISSGLLTSKGGISFGFLPDSSNNENMAEIDKALDKKSAAYGWYSQITSTTYDDSQLTQVMDDLISSGAVFIPAVMPTGVKFSEIDSDLAGQIAASMKKFTDKDVEVWLRFAHEVNYYVQSGTYAGGSPDEFIAAWKNVKAAVASNPKVKMF